MLAGLLLAAPWMERVARPAGCVATEAPPDTQFACSLPCPKPTAASNGSSVDLTIKSMESDPRKEVLTFRAIPDLSGFDGGTTVPLTIQVEGYEPWEESVRVPAGAPEEICVTMVPLRNLEVKLQGAGASATIFVATKADGKEVDHCSIDAVVGKDHCGLHVPTDLTDTKNPVFVTLRVVGTINAQLETKVYAGKVTQIGISAPRKGFTIGADVGISLSLLAAGFGAYIPAGFGHQGADIGWDITGGALTIISLATTYFLVAGAESETVHWTQKLPGETTPTKSPPLPGFLADSSRHHVAVHAAPSGFSFEW
jgi:hypothetical protein